MSNRFFHININVADLDRSIRFYGMLGFKPIIRTSMDKETKRKTAEAFGQPELATSESEFALLRIGGNPISTCLDLVEWRGRPTHGTPYRDSNHAGMYRFLVHVDDPDATLELMKTAGHPPIGSVLRTDRGPGEKPITMFNVLDPDGVCVEIAGGLDHLVADKTVSGNRFYHVNINVADLERSIRFYEIFGFKALFRTRQDPETSRKTALAFNRPFNEAEYSMIRIGDDPAAGCIDLVEWKTRPTFGTPYENANHPGIYRILVHVSDPEGTLKALEKAGHGLMGPVLHATPFPGKTPTTMFCVRDPDGVVVEVAAGLEHLIN